MAATNHNCGAFRKGDDPRRATGEQLRQGGHKRQPVRTAIPVLRQFFEIVDRDFPVYSMLNFTRDAVCRWRSGKRSPYLIDFWEAAHHLGYDVVLVPRAGAGSTHGAPQAADGTHSSEGTHAGTATHAA